MVVRDWNGRPHASPSVVNTRVCLEILSPGYSKHDWMEHPAKKWHALSVQKGVTMENRILITYRITFQINHLLLNSMYNQECILRRSRALQHNILNDVSMM